VTPIRKAKLIKYAKHLLDVLLSWLFISMMLLWAAKYFFADAPLLLKFEAWVGDDQPMHLSLGFFVPLCVAWLARIYRCRWKVQATVFLVIAVIFACDEVFQAWVPYRSSTWHDFQTSITGWGLAVLVWFCLWHLLFQPTRVALADDRPSS
jgi:hypothetical protein